MLYVFSGNDSVGVRTKALKKIHELSEDASIRTFDVEQYEEGRLTHDVFGTSLFGEVYVRVCDTLSGEEAAYEELKTVLSELSASDIPTVVIEGKLLAEEQKLFKKYAKEFVEVTEKESGRFNAFALAEALSVRDKKTLWLLLLRAQENGLSAEEIIGTLFWQLKSLRLAKLATDAKEAGMNPFPFQKAKTAAKKFTTEELQNLSRDLLLIYHHGHLGKTDVDLSLERWVLKV